MADEQNDNLEQALADFDADHFRILAVLFPDEMHFFRTIAKPVEIAANVAVISEGQDAPKNLYFVKSGMLMVSKQYDHETFEVGTITPGEIFGEASILYESTAGAEVRTTEQSLLYEISGEQVLEVVKSNDRFMRALSQISERRSAATAIAINPIFSRLPQAIREIIIYNAQFISLESGEILIKEGDTDTRFMFLILAGKAEISIQHPADKKKRIVFALASSGDEVGEISVVTGKPHAATVTAVTPLRLMIINNEAVNAWKERYTDFGYAMKAIVQKKLQHSLEATRSATQAKKNFPEDH